MAQSALAQTDPFPAKSIRIIASTSPGGLTDLLARNLGRLMSESLGQQVVVENRPGASGNIGTQQVAQAASARNTPCAWRLRPSTLIWCKRLSCSSVPTSKNSTPQGNLSTNAMSRR